MIGLSSSVALTSTVGVTAASMDTALEAVAEDETETETETDSEEDVAETETETDSEEDVTETAADGEEDVATVQKETVKINFYSEEEEKQIAEKEIEVDKGTTQINASEFADLVPEGYELKITGDVAISGGWRCSD